MAQRPPAFLELAVDVDVRGLDGVRLQRNPITTLHRRLLDHNLGD